MHSEISMVATGIGRRIKALRQAKGLTQKEFSDSLGIVQGFLSSIERGKKSPSDTLLIALCHYYGINKEWLTTGRGEMVRLPERAGGAPTGGTPLLKAVPADFPTAIPPEAIQEVVALPDVPPGCYALVCYGDFMAPTIHDGDLVIFRPHGELGHGVIVLVTNRWGEAILRRYRVKEGEVYLSPDNAAYTPFRPDPETRILGTVVQVWRKVKL
ncbi:LexA family protein [Geotalea uraniireducens]|nr:XRE family transcriptional regulator [Geotalea uraniireducens]